MQIDVDVFNQIHGLFGQWGWVDQIAFILDQYGLALFSLVIVLALFTNRKLFWEMVVTALLSRGIFKETINLLYQRPRPLDNLSDPTAQSALDKLGPSFPSGHASYYFAIAFIVYLYNRKFGVILLIAALLFSTIRIYLGYHYPLDILGGAIIAALAAFLVVQITKHFEGNHK